MRKTSARRLPSGSYVIAATGDRNALTGRFAPQAPKPTPDDGGNTVDQRTKAAEVIADAYVAYPLAAVTQNAEGSLVVSPGLTEYIADSLVAHGLLVTGGER